MKKFIKYITTLVASAVILITGCTTLNNLTPAQVAAIGVIITQTADAGAVYAIQQDAKNANYFKLANIALDNFANGTDLSPVALQAALNPIVGTNQWVNLAISGVVIAYDISYSKYISGQLTNSPAAKIWILDVKLGFEQALAQTGTATLRVSAVTTVPYFVKNGKVDRAVIKDRINNALKVR